MNGLKLKLHLIPGSAFCNNIRNDMGDRWKELSRYVRNWYHRTCQYCGWQEQPYARQYTQLHEIWEWDEETRTQRLAGFECLCPTCHAVHHWGFSQISGKDMDALLKHACWVNQCTEEEFKKHLVEAKKEWDRRSEIKWDNVDYGEYWLKGIK